MPRPTDDRSKSVALASLPEDLVATIELALAERNRVAAVVSEAVGEGLSDLWFVGAGGSHLTSSQVGAVMAAKATSVPTFRLNSNEFVYDTPARLGPDSLVVVISHNGTTPETIKAIETARSRGVRAVLAIAKDPGNPLAEKADEAFTYGGTKHVVSEPTQIYLAQIGHSVLMASGDETQSEHDAALDAYAGLGDAIVSAVAESDDNFAAMAASLGSQPIIYVLGAGPSEDIARTLSMCYLQEMQWIHSAAYNAGDFFHGAFEVVTEQTPVILYLGEDTSRPIAERARAFIQKYTRQAWLVDLQDMTLPGIPKPYRAEVGQLVLGALTSRIAQHFEAATGHSLTERRYLFKVQY
jgi:fructoselysine-6-P-deglycase FrlB-like protein